MSTEKSRLEDDDEETGAVAEVQPLVACTAFHDQAHPFRPGVWVAKLQTDSQWPQIAKVRDAYDDWLKPGSILLDLVLYDASGKRLGRASPAMGGPRSFEPACGAEAWTAIEEPDFEKLSESRYGYRDLIRPLTKGAK